MIRYGEKQGADVRCLEELIGAIYAGGSIVFPGEREKNREVCSRD